MTNKRIYNYNTVHKVCSLLVSVSKYGHNAIFFKTDNISDLSLKILEFYENKPFWIKQRKEICNYCKENYSVENMAKKFINLL